MISPIVYFGSVSSSSSSQAKHSATVFNAPVAPEVNTTVYSSGPVLKCSSTLGGDETKNSHAVNNVLLTDYIINTILRCILYGMIHPACLISSFLI